MIPTFKLTHNDNDITARLKPHLVSIEYTDEVGAKSDQLKLELHGKIRRAELGGELRLWLGWDKADWRCGWFNVASIERSGFYDLTVTATGADFGTSLKELRSEGFEWLSLAEMAARVAARHNLDLKTDVGDVRMVYTAQQEESDLQMMTRLASAHDLSFAVKEGTLILLTKSAAASESSLPVFHIDYSKAYDGRITAEIKKHYKSAEAKWQDPDKNTVESVVVGEGVPKLTVPGPFSNKTEALAKTKSALTASNRGDISGSLTIRGQRILAGSILDLTSTPNGDEDGKYQIDRVTHSFTPDASWTTTIDFTS